MTDKNAKHPLANLPRARIEQLVLRSHELAVASRLRAKRRLRLPTFIGIGEGRCGTTSLWHWLRSHPDVYLSPVKEVDYFRFASDPAGGLDGYRRYFMAAEDQKHVGEFSPGYIASPKALAAIRDLIPGVKVVVTLRNPVDRFLSQFHYHQRYHKRTDLLAFIDEGIAAARTPGWDPASGSAVAPGAILVRSRYAARLKRVREWFPGRHLVLCLEHLKADPADYATRIGTFLDIPVHTRDFPRENSLKHAMPPAEVLAEARRRLWDFLREDADRLAAILPGLPDSFYA
jgi:hypothetical protein